MYGSIDQAKPETVSKVVEIVKKQLALPDDRDVNGASTFATLGADSLDTVMTTIDPVTQCLCLVHTSKRLPTFSSHLYSFGRSISFRLIFSPFSLPYFCSGGALVKIFTSKKLNDSLLY